MPKPESAWEPQHQFNPEFIKARGIKKITLDIIDKKDYQVAVDKNLVENYEFNSQGDLLRYYYTNIAKTIERQVTHHTKKGIAVTESINEYIYDTVSVSYFYSNNKLILKRYHNGLNYYESRYYRYDELGNVTKELRFRETNNSTNASLFLLGNQVLLSEDSFQYRVFSGGQLKCIFLNNENRPYKERITNYDSLGRKKSIQENYIAASWIVQEQSFEYQGNLLSRALFHGNANREVNLVNTYEYDNDNNLYTEKQYRDTVLVKELSYVTGKTDSLLNSIVIRDPVNATIRIVKLQYELEMLGKRAE